MGKGQFQANLNKIGVLSLVSLVFRRVYNSNIRHIVLQSTCHYMGNHYVKLWWGGGVGKNRRPLSWGGGGGGRKDFLVSIYDITKYLRIALNLLTFYLLEGLNLCMKFAERNAEFLQELL